MISCETGIYDKDSTVFIVYLYKFYADTHYVYASFSRLSKYFLYIVLRKLGLRSHCFIIFW